MGTLCTDSSGNCYLTGYFAKPNGIFGNDTLAVSGYWDDAFIVKINNNGNFLWAKRAGGADPMSSTSSDGGRAILYSKTDNTVIFAGAFDSNGPQIGSCNVLPNYPLTFLSKLDTSGNCIWSISEPIGGGLICLDNSGNIYMTGHVITTSGFGCGTLPKGGFLAKYNSSGACMGIKHITDYGNIPRAIFYSNNKLYIQGNSANDTLLLDTAIAYCYPNDVFISEFDTAGNVQWVKTMGGPKNESSNSISLDGSGNIYTTGIFKDTAYFESTILTNGTNKDWFLSKHDSDGNLLWVRQAHISGTLWGGHTVSAAHGNIYVEGGFAGTATFGTFTVTANTSADLFVARYDSNGNCIGVEQAGNYIFNGQGNIVNNSVGGFYIAGSFHDTTAFGSFPLISYGVTAGGADVFVAKHDAITGVGELGRQVNDQLIIYANPTAGTCNIKIPDDFVQDKNLVLSIYDNTGKLVQEQKLEMNDGKIKLNLEAEAKGIYHAVLSNGKKNYNGKIVFE